MEGIVPEIIEGVTGDISFQVWLILGCDQSSCCGRCTPNVGLDLSGNVVNVVRGKALYENCHCFVKLLGKKPEKRNKWEPMKDDIELGNSVYPIPMYNEKEVYQLSIRAACALSWPSDQTIIQVLDDSTDTIIKENVKRECCKWSNKGVNIKYEIRDNRNGYKSGALKEGMKLSYVSQCDYVVILDADFQPDSDFLLQTFPFLIHNPRIALVQARWKFGKRDINDSIICSC